jgi:hypothetical protein
VPGRAAVLRFLLDIGATVEPMYHDHILGGVRNSVMVGRALIHVCTSDTEEIDVMVGRYWSVV